LWGIPKDARLTHFSFGESHLSHFGEMWLIQRFCNKLGLPARFVRESKRNVVKLPHDYHYQHEFLEASRKIQKLRLPRKFRICK